jgi:hypothetical protein
MCLASARRLYHSGRWVPSPSGTSTERLGIQLAFSSQLSSAKGSSAGMACIRSQLYIESYYCMKFFSVYGGAQQDATRQASQTVDPETRDCSPHLPPDAALSSPGPGDVSVVDQGRPSRQRDCPSYLGDGDRCRRSGWRGPRLAEQGQQRAPGRTPDSAEPPVTGRVSRAARAPE